MRARPAGSDEVVILAAREGRACPRRGSGGAGAPSRGPALANVRYEPPFGYITEYGPRGHTVLEADFVTTDDGTGLVHTAIAFGEDDFALGEQYGITLQNPVGSTAPSTSG